MASLSATMMMGCSGSQTAQTEATTTVAETTTAVATTEEATIEEATTDEVVEEVGMSIDDLVITYVTSPLNVPSIIDKEKGIIANKFADAGVEVEYVEITSGADQTQALASGDVQILNAVGASSVILSAAAEADIKVLSMYSTSPQAFALYTADENLKTPQDLAGKTIAGPVGTNLHQLLIAYLTTADMTLDDVNYVNMGIADAYAGLAGGSVDVALIGGATGYVAIQEGFYMIADGDGLIDAAIAVSVTEEFYNDHPDVIELFLEAQEEIDTFITENFDETISIVAKALDMDEEAIIEMYPQYDFSTEINDEAVAAFERTADFMLEADMIDTEVDIDSLFFN